MDNPRSVFLPYRSIEGDTPGRLLASLPMDSDGVKNLIKAVANRNHARFKIKLYELANLPKIGLIGGWTALREYQRGQTDFIYLNRGSKVPMEKNLVDAVMSADYRLPDDDVRCTVEFIGISAHGDMLFNDDPEIEEKTPSSGNILISASDFAWAVGLMQLDENTEFKVIYKERNPNLLCVRQELGPGILTHPHPVGDTFYVDAHVWGMFSSYKLLAIIEENQIILLKTRSTGSNMTVRGFPSRHKNAVSESGAVEFFKDKFHAILMKAPVFSHSKTHIPDPFASEGFVVENPISHTSPTPRFERGDRVMLTTEGMQEVGQDWSKYEGVVTRVKWEKEFGEYVVFTDGPFGGRGVLERLLHLDERATIDAPKIDPLAPDVFIAENPSGLSQRLNKKKTELVDAVFLLGQRILPSTVLPRLKSELRVEDIVGQISGKVVGYKLVGAKLVEKTALKSGGFKWLSLSSLRMIVSKTVCGSDDAMILVDDSAATTVEALQDYWQWVEAVWRPGLGPLPEEFRNLSLPDILVPQFSTKPEETERHGREVLATPEYLDYFLLDRDAIQRRYANLLPDNIPPSPVSTGHTYASLIEESRRYKPERYLFEYTPPPGYWPQVQGQSRAPLWDYNNSVCFESLHRGAASSDRFDVMFAGIDEMGQLLFEVVDPRSVLPARPWAFPKLYTAPCYIVDYIIAAFYMRDKSNWADGIKMKFVTAADAGSRSPENIPSFLEITSTHPVRTVSVPLHYGFSLNIMTEEQIYKFFSIWFGLERHPRCPFGQLDIDISRTVVMENPPNTHLDVVGVVREALVNHMAWRRISDDDVEYILEDQSGSVVAKVGVETDEEGNSHLILTPESEKDAAFCRQQLYDLEMKLLRNMGKRFPVQFSSTHEWVNGKWRNLLGFDLDDEMAPPTGKLHVVSEYWDFLVGRDAQSILEAGQYPPEVTSNPGDAEVAFLPVEAKVDPKVIAILTGARVVTGRKSALVKAVYDTLKEGEGVRTTMAKSKSAVLSTFVIVPSPNSPPVKQGIVKATERYKIAMLTAGPITEGCHEAKMVGVNIFGHVIFEDQDNKERITISPGDFASFLGIFGYPVGGTVAMSSVFRPETRAVVARTILGETFAFSASTFVAGVEAWEKEVEGKFWLNVLTEEQFALYLRTVYAYNIGEKCEQIDIGSFSQVVTMENPSRETFECQYCAGVMVEGDYVAHYEKCWMGHLGEDQRKYLRSKHRLRDALKDFSKGNKGFLNRGGTGTYGARFYSKVLEVLNPDTTEAYSWSHAPAFPHSLYIPRDGKWYKIDGAYHTHLEGEDGFDITLVKNPELSFKGLLMMEDDEYTHGLMGEPDREVLYEMPSAAAHGDPREVMKARAALGVCGAVTRVVDSAPAPPVLDPSSTYVTMENPDSTPVVTGVFRGVQLTDTPDKGVCRTSVFDPKEFMFAGYWTRSPTVAALFAARPRNNILHDVAVKRNLERFLVEDPDSLPRDGPAWLEYWLDDVTSRRRSEMGVDTFGLIFRAEGEVSDESRSEYMLEMEVRAGDDLKLTDVGVIDQDTYPPRWIPVSEIPQGATYDDVRRIALKKGQYIKWIQDTIPLDKYRELVGPCPFCIREPCHCGAGETQVVRQESKLDGLKTIDKLEKRGQVGIVRNPKSNILVVVPKKNAKTSKSIAKRLDGWAVVNKNTRTSCKKVDLNSPSSRSGVWRKSVLRSMKDADLVIVLEDSEFSRGSMMRICDRVPKSNLAYIEAVAKAIGGVLYKCKPSDVQKQAEEFGRPSITIHVNKCLQKDADKIAASIREAIDTIQMPSADKSIDKSSGRWCSPCKVFYRNNNKRKCDRCAGKLVCKPSPPNGCEIV